MQHLLSEIALVAPSEATVLIHGDSGTGKELVARACLLYTSDVYKRQALLLPSVAMIRSSSPSIPAIVTVSIQYWPDSSKWVKPSSRQARGK